MMGNSELEFPIKISYIKNDGRLIDSFSNDAVMQIIKIVSGNVSVEVGTDVCEASAGDILYVPPRLAFRSAAISGPASVSRIEFDVSIIEENMDNFDNEILYMFDVRSRGSVALFKEGSELGAELSRYMCECVDEFAAKDVCYKLPIRANIYKIITLLLRSFCGSKDEHDRMIYHNVLRLRPVITYINENFSDKIYINLLADMINVSADYFTKMFKESIGKTPVDYINGVRVNHAMYALATTDNSVAEISDEIGFCNSNYFHKIFKQYMSLSPLAYRKSVKRA